MTIKISIEGTNVQEVLSQMLSILNVPPAATPPASSPKTNGNGVDKAHTLAQATPTPAGKRPVGRPPKPPVVLSDEKPAENNPVPAGEEIVQPDDPNPVVAGAEKSAADIRHDAVLVLKKVYTKGAVGQAKVDEICKHFNVTKLVDIPLDRAIELLQMSNRALFALGG